MSLPDDVDFQFLRRIHGWSEAKLYVDGYLREEFILTHIFDDPLEAICTATVCLANGADEVFFSWFCEPGQYDWKFSKVKSEHHLLDVLIYDYLDILKLNHCQSSTHQLHKKTSFRVARDFWIALVTSEAEKIARLLTYRHYKINRDPHTFPWQELKELKQYRDRKSN